MNSKDIFIVVLLLVILAIVYKIMQSSKFQTDLTIGIAKKAGVEIPKQQKGRLPFMPPTEDGECTDCENEEEAEYEEETEEEKEQGEEEENQDESKEGAEEEEEQQRTVRDLEPRNHMIRVVKPKTEVESPKKKLVKDKSKGYEKIVKILESPLTSGDLKEKWNTTYGNTPPTKIVSDLNYAIKLNLVKKHSIGTRFLYGTAEMFDGDQLKQEYLPQPTT